MTEALTEKQLSKCITDHARKLYGYELVYHTFVSMYSPRGFPDLVLVREEPRRMVIAELKSANGKLTADQERWIELLTSMAEGVPHMAVCVWRPDDWYSGAVDEVLR